MRGCKQKHGLLQSVLAAVVLTMAAASASAQIAFTDVTTAAGLDHSSESYGASWGDLDGDGYLDLFASNHRTQQSLFLNLRNGTFSDIALQVSEWVQHPEADTHGGSWADFDNDGDQDLMIATGSGASQFLVNENRQLINRAANYGLDTANRDARLPVWLDYDNDHRPDVLVAQYAGPARLFHQNTGGGFTDATSAANLQCVRFHYAQLIDVNGDGRLDLLCPDESAFPQKIYDTSSLPWKELFNSAQPASFFPVVRNVVDSAIADFNNDGSMDLFVLGGVQLRPSSVVQEGNAIEALLAGGGKGLKFVSAGVMTFTIDWNNGSETASGTDVSKIQIGARGIHPAAASFTLDPRDPDVAGMPRPPTSASNLPVMQIGYEAATHRWTVAIVTKLNSANSAVFSQAYLQVRSSAAVSDLGATGLWPTDGPGRPTLLINRAGRFMDETSAAGLASPVQCSSVTAGDFDNDMYVDLYLACRTGASNIANILYHNNGNGTFTAVPAAAGAAGPTGLAIADGAGTADSVVAGDYDVDGFLDLFVTNGFNLQPRYVGGPNKLFHNQGNANHWIELDLVGVNSDRDATGTRVYAMANGVPQLRVQDGRYHRWSQDAKRIHFGLASAQRVTLTVKWPSGATQSFADVPADGLYQITEGGAGPVPLIVPATPTPPTGLTATAGNGAVQLSWGPVPGAVSYNVYQSTAAGGEGTTPILTGISGTTATVTSLANGTTYFFVVSADTAAGPSGLSNEASATPVAPPTGTGGGSGSSGGSTAAAADSSGGGGAMDFWSLLAIAVLGFARRRRVDGAITGARFLRAER